ncbi:MAG: OmpA family protein [Rhizobiaceae bacterium]|nr:OmpA family protein [Rhizobiaceae bacterium]
MNRSQAHFAGGAIALLLASTSAYATQVAAPAPAVPQASRAAIVLAQADCEGENCLPVDRKRRHGQDGGSDRSDQSQPQASPLEKQQLPAAPKRKPKESPAPKAEAPAPRKPKPAALPEPERAPAPRAKKPQAEQLPTRRAAPELRPEAPPKRKHREQEAPAPVDRAEPSPLPVRPTQKSAPAPDTAQQPVPRPKELPRRSTAQPQPQPQVVRPKPRALPEQPTTAPNDAATAPVLDSQKSGENPVRPRGQDRQNAAGSAKPRPVVKAGPPPTDDRAAQEAVRPESIVPLTREKGTRRQSAPEMLRRERPEGAEVVRRMGDRTILDFGGQAIVESDDRQRLGRGARDVYYEDLPRGRTREVIQRPNGIQVVTIRNRYGDVIRRSRIMPDGREYVLVYVEDNDLDRVREWRDPGDDLPPMQLGIPVDDYIFDAERARAPDDYYDFLSEPPVERVERLYSVDEVKRSARIRDKTRRIDLDTITFEFGQASIQESEIVRLEGVATAMQRLLEANPAETFLIEGHTDAVGSDIANLALSDRRAEAVADALTNVFGIPPENLSTQGYGERFLKVRTEGPERENRRVAIRRITPLVAPVASAN